VDTLEHAIRLALREERCLTSQVTPTVERPFKAFQGGHAGILAGIFGKMPA
jgi:hypothetical protein